MGHAPAWVPGPGTKPVPEVQPVISTTFPVIEGNVCTSRWKCFVSGVAISQW